MTSDDPFAGFESDQTIIKPNPGARARQAAARDDAARDAAPNASFQTPAHATSDTAPDTAPDSALDAAFGHGGASNPLVAACTPLLRLAPQIRAMSACANPAALCDSLARGIRHFEAGARASGVPQESITAARYIVCTMLDEAASSTPWGAGAWSRQSLLVLFHNETWGGEKVFQLLSRLAQKPAQHLHLLELLSVVLALGFEGRYRVATDGRRTLAAVRERLYQMIRAERGEPERALSPHWTGVATPRRRVSEALPVWVAGALALFVLALVYFGLSFRLNGLSDPVFDTIASIHAGAARATVIAPAARPRLAEFLAPEIRDGLVTVSDQVDRSVVTIRGDGMFEPGSAELTARMKPLVQRIGVALNAVPGKVRVAGHSDNQPIRSARFPSNWALSEARAATVRDLLAASVAPARLTAEGEGDANPLAPNDTPAGRARNRRVEVTLFAKPGA